MLTEMLHMLGDPAHWGFEIVSGAIIGVLASPLARRLVRRHDRRHHRVNGDAPTLEVVRLMLDTHMRTIQMRFEMHERQMHRKYDE